MAILKSIFSSVIARVAIIAIIAVVALVFRDRIGGAASELVVGDCFDLPASVSEIEIQEIDEVQHHPCSEPHDAEAFLVEDYPTIPSATYPPESAFDSWGAVHCEEAFVDYTEFALDDGPNVGYAYFWPTSGGWAGGDREMICYLGHIDGTKATTTYRATP